MHTLRSFLPPADVHVGDRVLTLTMDVPGVAPDQLEEPTSERERELASA